MPPTVASAILNDVRHQIDVAASVTTVVCIALQAQAADYDEEVAVSLRRCVVDVLGKSVEWIDEIIRRCRALRRLPVGKAVRS